VHESNIMKWDKICNGKSLKNFLSCEQQKQNSKFSQYLQENLNSVGPIDEIMEGVQGVKRRNIYECFTNILCLGRNLQE